MGFCRLCRYTNQNGGLFSGIQCCNEIGTKSHSRKFAFCLVEAEAEPDNRVLPLSATHCTTHQVSIKQTSHFLGHRFEWIYLREDDIRICNS